MRYILLACVHLLIVTVTSAQQFLPALSLVKGNTYHQDTRHAMKIYQTIEGKEIEIVTGIRGCVSFQVTDVNDSLYTLKTRYDTLALHIEGQGISQSFSSADQADPMSSLLHGVTKHSFTVVMFRTGRIKSVTGISELIDNLINSLPSNIQPDKKEAVKQQLSKAYGEAAFKGSFESVTNIFPDRQVRLQEKWEKVTQLESLMAATKKSLYHLEEVTEEQFVIHGTSTEKTANKDAYMPIEGSTVRYDFEGGSTSTFIIDRKTGWIIKADIKNSISGSANIKASVELPNGMVIPMKMHSELSITGK